VFGLLADRYGRKLPLMIDLVFYSVVEVLTGLAPSYATFLVLRALFGIGMGAEWGVGASLVMEKVPARYRGVVSGLLQQGYALGYLLAAVCYLVVFPRWGWRPLFFIGGLPALLALFVRARVRESDVWRETRHDNWSGLGRAIASNWKLFLYLTILMAMMNMVSHGTQDMYPTFLERDWGFRPTTRAALTAFSQAGARVPAGLRLSVRRGHREPDPARAGTVRHGHELRASHGALRGHGVHPRCRGRGARARAPGSGIRARGSVALGVMATFIKATQAYQQGQRTLPRRYYVDAGVYAEEQERIFARRWVCVGRAAELSAPGEYVVRAIAGESVVLVRGQDGAV